MEKKEEGGPSVSHFSYGSAHVPSDSNSPAEADADASRSLSTLAKLSGPSWGGGPLWNYGGLDKRNGGILDDGAPGGKRWRLLDLVVAVLMPRPFRHDVFITR